MQQPETPLSKDEEIAALQRTVAHLKRQQGQIIDTMLADIAQLTERMQEMDARLTRMQRRGRPPKESKG